MAANSTKLPTYRTTVKYKRAIRCLMEAVGVKSPAVLGLMGNPARLYKVLWLCGYRWQAKRQVWTFADR